MIRPGSRPSRTDTRPRRGSTARFGAVLVLAAGLLGPAGTWAAPLPTIDYLYVDANEGGASGGHAGVRFGDEVYHFEYRAPGTIRLRRDDFAGLLHRYTILDNRSLVIRRIPVSDDTFRLLRDEFARRHMVQDQHLRARAALGADRRLLAALLAHRTRSAAEEPIQLDGVGFFFEQARPPDARPDPTRQAAASDGATSLEAPALVALRARVAEAHGADFIDAAMDRIRGQLLDLGPEERPRPRDLSAEQAPASAYGFAGRYQDLFVSLLSLEVLRDARPLRMDGVTGTDGDGPLLDDADRDLVDRLRGALESSLVRLLRSSRPDRGFPLLVGMARLIALDEARRAGTWRFLDAFAPDAPVIPAGRIRERPGLTEALLAEAREDFAAARARLAARAESHAFPEADFVTLEAAGNRLIETSRTVEGRRPMRLGPGLRVPSRPAALAEPIAPSVEDEALARHAATASEHEAAYESELRRLYGYNVVTRNCVTEIFRTIDAALASTLSAPDADGIRRESTRRLGGHVDAEGPLTFIPAASALAVRDAYAGVETIEVPSYRLAALARMYRQDNVARVYLRESNTLTSTLYRRNPADSAFLFFTDDMIAIRPLLGVLNLVAGVGVSAAGLFALPIDGGDLLSDGLRGLLFSLPELAFFNIRKGSLMWAPRPREHPAPALAR